VCFIVHKTTSELERAILTTLNFVGAENTGKKHKQDAGMIRHLADAT
jgi:hypothetical protein